MERYSYYSNSTRVILPCLDIIIILGAFRTASFLLVGRWALGSYYTLVFAIFALLWWILSDRYVNIYRVNPLITYRERLFRLVRACLLHAGILLSAAIVLQLDWLSGRFLALVYGLMLTGVVLARFLFTFARRTYCRLMARSFSRFVIVGDSPSGQELYNFLTAQDSLSNQFLGFFANNPMPAPMEGLRRGEVQAVMDFCRQEQVNEIYFALPLDEHELIEDLSRFADQHFIAFRIIPDFKGIVRKDVSVYFYDHLPVLAVRHHPLSFRPNQLIKRVFDVCFAGVVILGVFPFVLPLLALLIKLDSRGPVFFKQMRPGKRNELFPCYKLRTMRTDLSQGELQASKGDPRVTRVGRFLRKSNLDELPQFFNVLLGHMSVVGPRPNMISQLEEYSKHIHEYPLRHSVTPGITGYAQVNGYRGETRAPQAMEKRVEYDLKYMENWTFELDLRIIGKTVWNMVRGEKNAY